jgi:23S rRNA pseudouridine2605 synthase/23S rRNA pseudouridine2604 synthase
MRLQKFLAAAGVCSRRRGEIYIAQGRVRVNGKVVSEPGTQVDPGEDRVEVDGRIVTPAVELVYLALNKPPGVVTSCRQRGVPLVVDLVDLPQRIFPVGRLDKDSSGLVILTNDGRLHHGLLHPSFDHEKEYDVTVAAPIADAALARLAAGLPVLGSRTRPAEVRRLGPRRFRMILKEGRNRQIRRMLRQVGHQVVILRRVRFVNVRLGRLPEGRWRPLTPAEREGLLAQVSAPAVARRESFPSSHPRPARRQ